MAEGESIVVKRVAKSLAPEGRTVQAKTNGGKCKRASEEPLMERPLESAKRICTNSSFMQTQQNMGDMPFIWGFVECDPLIARAFRAYWMTAKKEREDVDQPSSNGSAVEQRGNKAYVVLRNPQRTLAVYRVRTDGILKRLKRWPKEIS